ncbi:MAG TPA: decaprenyl-phosphate phosphoribosyltransferase [Solirubrobacteraceae bacterium]|nr:decaprenyl-phosphate phosphoribosyltransferase [Solirubrobacteraceae bacterium]
MAIREEQFQIDSPAAPEAVPGASLPGLLRALRPKQWVKNLLVAAAPGAAGVLTEADSLWRVGLAFVAFCMVSSATYLVNDVGDAEEDRRHPTKRHRPVAAGLVSPRTALSVAAVLGLGGFAVALAVRPAFLALVAGYVATTVAYTLWLKHMAVFDIAVVASGFIFRAVAGGVAVDVPISRWFLIVTSFGSLFIVAGKRYSEHVTMGAEREATRATLAAYSRDYLRYVYTMASAVMLTGYCLWAFEQSELETTVPWFELSIGPVVLGVLRYALLLEEGYGGAPEDIALGDRPIQVLGVIWLVLFGAGVSVAH